MMKANMKIYYKSPLLILLIAFQTKVSLPLPFDLPESLIITPHLQNTLELRGSADIFITLKQGTSKVLRAITSIQFLNRNAKLKALHEGLVQHAWMTQQPILQFLQSIVVASSVRIKSFWITNQIYVKNADATLVSEIVTQFSDSILHIDEEFIANLIEPVSVNHDIDNVTLNNEIPQWGIVKIQAPEAWEEIRRKKTELKVESEDVIIATIDTGVRGTHESLKDNFVGEYGWFDPYDKTMTPNDHNGHGTHTTGTIAGTKGIGVAPNAKWAACKGCPTVFCFQSTLLACGQFILCPTLPDGSIPDCSKAPHIVSNSWGMGRGNSWYNEVIDAWHAAGIIPIFSIGNSGPICSTADSPGDQNNVIAVGSTGLHDEISYFSSVGPTMDKRMKPEVVAPGHEILSAYHTADNAYATMSGTSMAAPHAAGTIALLKIINPELNYDQARESLMENADQSLRFSGRVCDGVRDNVFPNHVFGSGRINALKSVAAQIKLLDN